MPSKPYKKEWKPVWIILSHVLFAAMLALWFIPTTQECIKALDKEAFLLLNGSLDLNYYWQWIWMAMNHRAERWLNVVMMVGINFWIVFSAPKGQKLAYFSLVLFLWLYIEIGIYFMQDFIPKIPEEKRLSPSLVVIPFISLVEIFNNPDIKISSRSSFPGGHAFAAVFWAIFTLKFAPKKFWPPVIVVAIMLSIARMFSGAHWLTDTIFAALFAFLMLSYVLYTPLYYHGASFIERTLKRFKPLT